MKSSFIYILIALSGVIVAFSGPANSQLKETLHNPWLTAAVSSLLVVPIFFFIFIMFPHPSPTAQGLSRMPWWAPLGSIMAGTGLLAGQMFINRVGASVFTGTLVTANILTSILMDHFGWVNLEQHSLNSGRLSGAFFMILGIFLISRF